MKTALEIINEMTVNPANLNRIAETGKINGSLLFEIGKAMKMYAASALEEAAEKAFTKAVFVEADGCTFHQGDEVDKDSILNLIKDLK